MAGPTYQCTIQFSRCIGRVYAKTRPYIGHRKHQNFAESTGAKTYVCSGNAKSTGALFPLSRVRRLWQPLSNYLDHVLNTDIV